MKLNFIKIIDWYVGGILIGLLKPLVVLLGVFLRRDHDLTVKGNILFVKMMGGGSLVIALPALLGIRRAHPETKLVLLCTSSVRPYAETLGIFDVIHEVRIDSLLACLMSGLKALLKVFLIDTTVDLEVYSRMTTLFTLFSCARNRIGFYLESTFWRRNIHTHLLFYNRFSGSFLFYEQLGKLLASETASAEECRIHLIKINNLTKFSPSRNRKVIGIGSGCSDLAKERMLNLEQWCLIINSKITSTEFATLELLGGKTDIAFANLLQNRLSLNAQIECKVRAGNTSLSESLQVLYNCDEFWGIDSGLLHFARLLINKCESWWGPTTPEMRLRPIPQLEEDIHYVRVACSPCVHQAEKPPCNGDNVCITNLFRDKGDVNLQPFFTVR